MSAARQIRISFRKFHPRQQEIYTQYRTADRGFRFVLRCGRRFGKTELLETTASRRSIDGAKVGWFTPDYKLMRPTYDRILRNLRPIVKRHSKTDALIELVNDGSIEFWTLDNEDAGRSRSYDLAIIDEGSLVKGLRMRDTWEQAIAPTLLDRRGDAIVGGTPKGIDAENFFYEICTDKSRGWTECHAPSHANPALDAVGVAELKEKNAPLVYQQEYLAEFVDWSGEAFFSQDKMLIDGQPLPTPALCDCVYAVVDSAVKTGRDNDGTGVTYYALKKFGPDAYLYILDWSIIQISGDLLDSWLAQVFTRLTELAVECKAIRGSLGVWIEDKSSGMVLLQASKRRNLPVHSIDSKLTSVGKDERAISVSGYVYRGSIKFTRFAFEKVSTYKGTTKNHLLSQVLSFRIGDKGAANRDDDLLDTFTYGIAIGLGDKGGF